jgi:hypothetical protein
VLENALVELVKNVRCNGEVNISIREPFPERMLNVTRDPLGLTQGMELTEVARRSLSFIDNFHGGSLSASLPWSLDTQFISRTLTFRACTVLRASDQALLWIIGHIACQNRIHHSNLPITSSHLHPVPPNLLQWPQNGPHGVME